jgi:sensor histidine kinase regulating citrate/malate metabolism
VAQRRLLTILHEQARQINRQKGNGFGLSQVYGFVKQANGTVSIESNKTGTAVRMDLPFVGDRRAAA